MEMDFPSSFVPTATLASPKNRQIMAWRIKNYYYPIPCTN